MDTKMRKHATYPNNFQCERTKKSGRPTQPGNRSTAPRHSRRSRKQLSIVHHFFENVKRIKWGWIVGLVLVALIAVAILAANHGNSAGIDAEATEPAVPDTVIVKVQRTYVFEDGEGTPVDMQEMTSAWAAEAGYTKRYELTDAERWEIASVVTGEARGEPFAGKVAVAQCILQACEDDGIRPDEAVVKYKYCKSRPEPTEEALEAVAAVFDFGQVVTSEPIKYYYAPALVYSEWHETQDYVMTISGHKFFKEATHE